MTDLIDVLNHPHGRELVEGIEDLQESLEQVEFGTEEWFMVRNMIKVEKKHLYDTFGYQWND